MNNAISHTDKVLFSRIAMADEAAFEEVFRHYVPWVGRIIFRIVKSATVTQDLVQEVFLHLWLGRDKLTEVEDPVLWLYRIAYNQSYLYIRRQLVYERATAGIAIEQELLTHSNNTEHITDLRETTRMIQQAISQLAPQSRRIYQLSLMDGLKPQMIADELGISVQSVRNSLTRSAKLIRDHLAQQGIVIPLLLLILPFPEFF